MQLWTVAACVYFGDAVVSTDTPRNLRGDAAAASIPAPEPLSWPARPPTPKTLGGTAAGDAATGLPLGVSLRDAEARGLAAQYSTCCSGSRPVFVCDGGATKLPCTRVGDDYCDCVDGSDELDCENVTRADGFPVASASPPTPTKAPPPGFPIRPLRV